jgi:hypothetical protein
VSKSVEYTAVSLPEESIIIGRGVGTGGGASVALLPLCAVLLGKLCVDKFCFCTDEIYV